MRVFEVLPKRFLPVVKAELRFDSSSSLATALGLSLRTAGTAFSAEEQTLRVMEILSAPSSAMSAWSRFIGVNTGSEAS